MNCYEQFTEHKPVIIANLLYAFSAWWGLTNTTASDSDRQRLEASLCRAQRSGLYPFQPTKNPTLTQLTEDADNTLAVSYSPSIMF